MSPVVIAPRALKTSWKNLWAAISFLTANARKKLNNNMNTLFKRLKSGLEEHSCFDYSTLIPTQEF